MTIYYIGFSLLLTAMLAMAGYYAGKLLTVLMSDGEIKIATIVFSIFAIAVPVFTLALAHFIRPESDQLIAAVELMMVVVSYLSLLSYSAIKLLSNGRSRQAQA